jgi:hypothetical protein
MIKDISMDIKWRLVQLFLGEEGIAEVLVAEHNSSKVRCTCSVFEAAGRCNHSKFVRTKILENQGNYVVQIPIEVPDEDGLVAMNSLDSWRDFVYKYGKIEVID